MNRVEIFDFYPIPMMNCISHRRTQCGTRPCTGNRQNHPPPRMTLQKANLSFPVGRSISKHENLHASGTGSAFENVIYQVNGIGNIGLSVTIGISRLKRRRSQAALKNEIYQKHGISHIDITI